MNEAIISGCVSAVAAIIVAAISNNSTKKLIEYKIDELTKRVDKHNRTIERTFDLEKRMDVSEERQKVANNRILDLEHKCERIVNSSSTQGGEA